MRANAAVNQAILPDKNRSSQQQHLRKVAALAGLTCPKQKTKNTRRLTMHDYHTTKVGSSLSLIYTQTSGYFIASSFQ